jgi:chromosome segregation ATPase
MDEIEKLREEVEDLRATVEELNSKKPGKQLREEIEALRATVEELDSKKPGNVEINHLLQELTGTEPDNYSDSPLRQRAMVGEFSEDIDETQRTVARHDDIIDELGSREAAGPAEAWYATLQAARRLQSNPDHSLSKNRVRLHCDNIAQATGKTKRMASNYIERFADEKEGVTHRPHEHPSPQNNNEQKQKALIIDLDIWGDDD